MATGPTKYNVQIVPYPIVAFEPSAFKDTYGGGEGVVVLESYLHRPVDLESRTVIVFMHPVGGGTYLPLVRALARTGHHVIYCNSRYRAEQALIMEKVVLDLGYAINDAKQRLGYEKVVLAGWSGGGSLSLFYQQQATNPSVTSTPAGDPPDLTTADLVAADAIMLLAAHPSRHGVLAECIDPSIRNEDDPDDRDPALDLYGPDTPPPPYPRDWLARYRSAQLDRIRRITATVEERLAALKASGRPHDERAFVVHGTMADPAVFDPTIDPNDRETGTSYLGDARIVNNGPVGLARFCTLRSWLSQWSVDHARADGIRCAEAVDVPFLAVWNGADNICLPSMSQAMYDAVPHPDKTITKIEGANHYYLGADQKEPLQAATATCLDWLRDRGLGVGQ